MVKPRTDFPCAGILKVYGVLKTEFHI